MAIQSYSDLTASIADWIERDDLSTQIEDFVRLGEAHLTRELNIRTMELDVTLPAASGATSLDLPANYTEQRQLWWIDSSGNRVGVRFMLPALMQRQVTPGRPEYWGIDGGSIVFERPCDQDYSFVLRFMASMDIAGSGGVTALLMQLSPWQPANYVLLNYPDAYLSASLVEAYAYLRDNDGIALWTGKRDEAIASINAKEGRSKSGSTLRTETTRAGLGMRPSFDIRTGR